MKYTVPLIAHSFYKSALEHSVIRRAYSGKMLLRAIREHGKRWLFRLLSLKLKSHYRRRKRGAGLFFKVRKFESSIIEFLQINLTHMRKLSGGKGVLVKIKMLNHPLSEGTELKPNISSTALFITVFHKKLFAGSKRI